MISKMREDGIHTVIITNGHAEIQQTKLKACKAVELFDGILVGGEEVLAGRHEKPHPSIFLAACKLSGCQPSEVGRSHIINLARLWPPQMWHYRCHRERLCWVSLLVRTLFVWFDAQSLMLSKSCRRSI